MFNPYIRVQNKHYEEIFGVDYFLNPKLIDPIMVYFREMLNTNIEKMLEEEITSFLTNEVHFPALPVREGVEDELVKKMSSLGGVVMDAGKSEEVGGDKVGNLGTLGSTSSKESPTSTAEVTSGDKAIMGGSGDEQIVVATQKCLHLLKVAPPESKPLAGAPVPAGMLFSGWIKSYREVCGFKELIPHSYQKRTLAGNGQQGGPFKYRRH